MQCQIHKDIDYVNLSDVIRQERDVSRFFDKNFVNIDSHSVNQHNHQ